MLLKASTNKLQLERTNIKCKLQEGSGRWNSNLPGTAWKWQLQVQRVIAFSRQSHRVAEQQTDKQESTYQKKITSFLYPQNEEWSTILYIHLNRLIIDIYSEIWRYHSREFILRFRGSSSCQRRGVKAVILYDGLERDLQGSDSWKKINLVLGGNDRNMNL